MFRYRNFWQKNNPNKPSSPNQLPLSTINWQVLIADIAQANRAITRFDCLLVNNYKVINHTLALKEAVFSLKLTGQNIELNNYFNADKLLLLTQYSEFLHNINNESQDLELSIELLTTIHKKILLANNIEASSFRVGSVFENMGMQKSGYIPPEAQKILPYVANIIKYYHCDENDVLVQLGILFAQFELVVPFLDANSSVARTLPSIFLSYKGVLSKPTFYISEYLFHNKDKYQTTIKNITKNDDWHSWLVFFLDVIKHQSQQHIITSKNVVKIYNVLGNKLSAMPTADNKAKTLGFLFNNIWFNSNDFIAKTNINRYASFRILKFLVSQNILTSDNKPRGRTYFVKDLLAQVFA